MIEIANVSKSYGKSLVVDGLSLTLPKGGITSIIGPNGAGKSTLLSMIARLVDPDGGRIAVGGLDVATTRGDLLARHLAVLRQDNHLAMRLTVRDLVTFGRYPYGKGRLGPEDVAQIGRALSYLGLTELADRFLDELSGGQRQRAFVAMVICQDTDYMLFDEPLNNLDIGNAVAMMKLLTRATRELGKTAVVVLHDINFASRYSDHIVAMRDGRLHSQGTPAEMITPEVLRDLYGTAFEVRDIGGHRVAVYYG
ncbi:ABC transporter ATP-binding protein [Pleomorphomonas carboxyditropha]|uniref:Iron ABC transporter ATP-binding protein n=1 Tax=Pleomorphomonas carboxyditropha TaxID=2023338 RepID=A0A2G9WUU3_9HYPH|nr:ATP-binding cassette domain-containing protein [Pleomorphomonas carboxyditropha]PIO98082.1 iron ABC transporter ATP-binding protein [Pleomorphomonas carboxyditropha]